MPTARRSGRGTDSVLAAKSCTRRPSPARLTIVPTVVLLAALAAGVDLPNLLRSLEKRYNSLKTIELSFSETYTAPGRPARTESGTLYLRKPGRMRWQYARPSGKLFLTDGEYAYLYTPNNNRVEKMKTRETDDLRAPLAFLLGNLDLNKEFRRIEAQPAGDALTRIRLQPKSDRFPYSSVELLVNQRLTIQHLKIFGHDRSLLEFEFSGEKPNPRLPPELFIFRMPEGAELVAGS
ncbi:MAG: outer membrane lipoprotein carrier protein LolA [Acidobacteria bacterium]|nr:outer membrane lipoprotein carrier protein LolA [Acidobacteriota bacterium]